MGPLTCCDPCSVLNTVPGANNTPGARGGAARTGVLTEGASKDAGVPPDTEDSWVTTAGAEFDTICGGPPAAPVGIPTEVAAAGAVENRVRPVIFALLCDGVVPD